MILPVSTIEIDGKTNYAQTHIGQIWGEDAEGTEIKENQPGGASRNVIDAQDLYRAYRTWSAESNYKNSL